MVLEPNEQPPEEFSQVLERLRSEGIEAWFSCIAVPVQLEGQLASGECFLFHCRGRSCSLWIASEGGDPIGDPTWYQRTSRWEGSDAGLLDPDDAEAVFRELLAAYEPQQG